MTDEVRLRDVTEGDLPILFEHQQDPEANRMAAFPARDREAFTAHWAKILDDTTVTAKAIVFNGQVAGNIVSFEQSGTPKVGYWIGKSYWGKGIATKALSEFLVHVKGRPLYAHVAKHNVGSIRVLEKCGFTICGEDKVPSGAGAEEVEEFVLRLSSSEREEDSMSAEANKALVRRFYEEIDKGNLDAMDELVAEDYIDHTPPIFPGFPSGREGLKQSFKIFWDATPGYHRIEDQIAEGDKVVTRLTSFGKHEGDLPGAPRTGNDMEMTSITIHRIANGKLVEKWSEKDMIRLLRQIGVMPSPGQAGQKERP